MRAATIRDGRTSRDSGRLIAAVAILGMLTTVLVAQATPVAADETISTRVDDGDLVAAAITISQLRFPSPGSGSPAHVVVSRDDVFADSLAGSALLGNAPLLLTPTNALDPDTRAELQRLRAGTSVAYVLGGPQAIAPSVAQAIADLGYDVRRLAGDDRIGTSLAIANVARQLSGRADALLARAFGLDTSPGSGWVDSVAGGAFAADRTVPILLTPTGGMDPRVDAWLDANGITTTHLLGGPAALSQAVADAAPGPRRHAGDERTATAAAIATGLWGAPTTGPRDFTIINGAQDRGWGFGLAAAGLAADRDAPVLLVLDHVTPATRRLVGTCGGSEVDLTIIGDGSLVSGAVREYLDDLDGEACGPDRTLRRSATLARFESCDRLLEWYRTNAAERVTEYGLGHWYGGPFPVEFVEDDRGQPMPEAAPAADGDASSGGGNEEVSGTNVQEVGVDEPDIVKTDGDLVAVVANNGSVDLLDMTGINPRKAANLPAPNEYGQTELLLHGDVLTMLTTNVSFAYFAEDRAFAPGLPAPQTTTVTRWNVSLPDTPVKLSSFEMDGFYRSARLIDGVARIVVESGPHDLDFTFPQDNSEKERERALEHNRRVVKESTLENWLPSWGPEGEQGDGDLLVDCVDVHEPPAWSGFDAITVVTFDTASDTTPGDAATVVAQGQNVYASTERLLVTTGRWGAAFEDEQVDSTVSTEVHAFDISDPDAIAYTGSGSVNGYVINQFALSEYEGSIRIAATTEPPWSCCEEEPQQPRTESFVSVLQEQRGGLAEVGRVGGLGLGERIQAVRFYGDLGIVVTFRVIDPLYLIDLSEPTAPKVTGELKENGFSEYLHRIGEDLLLGIGVAADDEGFRTGAKATLYDISDPTKPVSVANHEVRDGYSPVGYDHRAFLHWPTTGDAFVPFSVYNEQHREFASVLRISEPGAMAKRGELSHTGLGEDTFAAQILRTFIIGDDVYSLSYKGLARHDLTTLATTSFTPLNDGENSCCIGPIEPVTDPVA